MDHGEKLKHKSTAPKAKNHLWHKSKKEVISRKKESKEVKKEVRSKLDELMALGTLRALENLQSGLESSIFEKTEEGKRVVVDRTLLEKVFDKFDDTNKNNLINSIMTFVRLYENIVKKLGDLQRNKKLSPIELQKAKNTFHEVDKLIILVKANPKFEELLGKDLFKDFTSLYEKDSVTSENEKEFFAHYKGFNDRISLNLGVDVNVSESIIERESEFNKDSNSPSGKGLMQLTSSPLNDIHLGEFYAGKKRLSGRGELYIKLFSKLNSDGIVHSIPDEKAKKLLLEAITLASSPKLDKKSWNKAIDNLSKNKLNPYVNMCIGNILLSRLGGIATEASDNKINGEIKLIKNISTKRFDILLRNKGINIENPGKALAELKAKLLDKDEHGAYVYPELREQFYVFTKYNANSNLNTKTYYALTVLAQIGIKEESKNKELPKTV